MILRSYYRQYTGWRNYRLSELRKTLRQRRWVPNWSEFGVRFLMTTPMQYMALIVLLPLVIVMAVVWATAGFWWAVLAGFVSYQCIYSLQYMLLQN